MRCHRTTIALVLLWALPFTAQQRSPNSTPDQALQKWRESKAATLRDDFGEFFPGKPYINRGISGQTTPQMLVRFRQDVIDLHPKVVVILAGTNDIAGNTGPMRLEDIEANYASMADLARANQIRVVFSSVLPVHNYTPESQNLFAGRPPEKILALNRWMKDYVAAHPETIYLDYFSAMVDAKGLLKRDLANDGLHPNAAGYKIMAPLAEKAITDSLGELKPLKRKFLNPF
jgi:lysophospholipase L1-like esterase